MPASSFCMSILSLPPETPSPSAPHLHKDALRVGPGHGVHGVKDEAEVLAGHEGLEQREVKHLLLWGEGGVQHGFKLGAMPNILKGGEEKGSNAASSRG